jgi:hypothetical protein
MAAVMAVGSAMAAGAMAATLSATYSNGTVSIGNVTTGKDQYTLLIVQGEKAAGSSEYKYYAKNTTIKQIDQNDAGVPFTSTTVGTLDAGSYKVLVGNEDGTVDTGIFVVGGTTEPDEPDVPSVQTKDVTIGDLNSNNSLDTFDAALLLNKMKNPGNTYQQAGVPVKVGATKTYASGKTLTAGDTFTRGDINASKALDTFDKALLVNKMKNPSNTYQLAGETLTIVVE